jgi:hypothetical protein
VASGASANALARSAVDFFSFVATANAARGDLFAGLFFFAAVVFFFAALRLLVVMISISWCNAH